MQNLMGWGNFSDSERGRIVSDGILEEKEKIDYALEKSAKIIKKYEEKYKMSSEEFLKRFKKGEIEEDDDTFSWWAELKVSQELETKLLLSRQSLHKNTLFSHQYLSLRINYYLLKNRMPVYMFPNN
ncbi:MAG TPA: hypothetical protein VK469_13065 [Candidatus Kapabacteria bacterium]|nr:hypothetical protein [Candidatus Kapabacteria bacterium]